MIWKKIPAALLRAAPALHKAADGTYVLFVLGLTATALRERDWHLQSGRGHCLDHLLPYIGISGAEAFFARRAVFRFAVFRLAVFRFVLRAGPRAPALRTVRFFARFFVFFFFAVIGM
jgi:hypothetical protein